MIEKLDKVDKAAIAGLVALLATTLHTAFLYMHTDLLSGVPSNLLVWSARDWIIKLPVFLIVFYGVYELLRRYT